ncbi:MAG: hypothetical protein LUF27_14665 [Lachnospiraceae bacterium]|nr:hypothetical protein [Lachnospiraceae bacterium]
MSRIESELPALGHRQQICRAHQVELRKLPSYLPGTQSLVLKTTCAGGEMEVICREIEEATGISCRVSSE